MSLGSGKLSQGSSVRFLLPALLVAFALAGTPVQGAGAPAKDTKTVAEFPEQAAVIPADKMPQLRQEALAGSAEAAKKLATYYRLVEFDPGKSIYWTQIRLENGDLSARYDLGAFLIAEPDEDNRTRGVYWLHRVQKDGPANLVEDAGYALKDLDLARKIEKEKKK